MSSETTNSRRHRTCPQLVSPAHILHQSPKKSISSEPSFLFHSPRLEVAYSTRIPSALLSHLLSYTYPILLNVHDTAPTSSTFGNAALPCGCRDTAKGSGEDVKFAITEEEQGTQTIRRGRATEEKGSETLDKLARISDYNIQTKAIRRSSSHTRGSADRLAKLLEEVAASVDHVLGITGHGRWPRNCSGRESKLVLCIVIVVSIETTKLSGKNS